MLWISNYSRDQVLQCHSIPIKKQEEEEKSSGSCKYCSTEAASQSSFGQPPQKLSFLSSMQHMRWAFKDTQGGRVGEPM